MEIKQSAFYQFECARRTLVLLATNLFVKKRDGTPAGEPRIGILKRGGIGDWILFHETLESIANYAQAAEITIFTEKQNAEIAGIINLADHLHIIDPKAIRSSFARKLQLLNRVSQSAFDIWIDADLSRTKLGDAMALASQSPVRIGYAANATAPCHAWRQRKLFTHLLPDNFGKTHMSARMAEISRQLQRIGLPRLKTAAHAARRKVSGLRHFSWQSDASNVMVVAPSASTPKRIWPVERFAEVINHLHHSRGIKPIIIGGPADKAVCKQLLGLIPKTDAVDMAGQLSLEKSLSLIGKARLLLTNESGPLHMGRMSNTPTVVLGSGADFTNYLQYPGQPDNYRVVTAGDKSCFDCSWNCTHKNPPGLVIKPCLDAVGGRQVIAAIESLLEVTEKAARA